jgi:hypothetical protein
MSKVESIQVRRFSQDGIDEFTSIIRRKDPAILSQIKTLINDDSFTELIKVDGHQVFMELKPILRRLEMAEHLFQYFGPGKPLGHISGDVGLWNWLSAAWMQTLLSAASETDIFKLLGKQEERWVLTSNTLRYHRHLVSSPFFAYESNLASSERAMCLLATPVLAPGEVVERIAGKRSLSIGSICHLATLLYFDSKTGDLRKGHTSGFGTPKMFSYYFRQLDVNVDYQAMDVDALLSILPSNFRRWADLAVAERAAMRKVENH